MDVTTKQEAAIDETLARLTEQGEAQRTDQPYLQNTSPPTVVTTSVGAHDENKAAEAKRAMIAQLVKEKDEVAMPDALEGALKRANDVWTLDRMRRRGVLDGDLYGDGQFMYTFKPVLGSAYCQERLAIGALYKKSDPASFVRMQTAYAEIIYYAMKGCQWPLRETVQDDEGHDIMEELQDEQGQVVYQPGTEVAVLIPKTVTLPITLDNVKRLDIDMMVDFLNSMSSAMTGEARG